MENLHVLRTPEEIEKLRVYLKQYDFVAFDTETTGLDKDAQVIGFSVCAEPDTAYYVILKYWDTQVQKIVTLPNHEAARCLIGDLLGYQLLAHNAVFDCEVIHRAFGIQLMPSVHTDTLLAAHLSNENMHVGLKEQGAIRFGLSAKKEQEEMKASIIANGGQCTKKNYELYKADANLIARYGAKDTILTYNLFFEVAQELIDQGLDKFFWEQETMPLLRGSTYQLNTVGLKVDAAKLAQLEKEIELNCFQLRTEIDQALKPLVSKKYPGTNKKNTFNFGSSQQLAWLLFIELGLSFKKLTDSGREVAKELLGRIPYDEKNKRAFISELTAMGYKPEKFMKTDKTTLKTYANKHSWLKKLLEYKKEQKILKTYVRGIQSKLRYNVIYPSFLQAGTTSGRFSSRSPNFQNLPRDDKRIKSCIVSRPGKVFVGADYSQLEPRVFTAVSQDPILLDSYRRNLDFYSTVGIPVFHKEGECSADKKASNYLGEKYPHLRQAAKGVALANAYGVTAHRHSENPDLFHEDGTPRTPDECQVIIDDYFEVYKGVDRMVKNAHRQVVNEGVVYTLMGRPRRIPEAQAILRLLGKKKIEEDECIDVVGLKLPYDLRNLLNLAVNHEIQGTAASIVNLAAIAFDLCIQEAGLHAQLVVQCHDELIAECPEEEKEPVMEIMKYCMEETTKLPGVSLIAIPKWAYNLADLK